MNFQSWGLAWFNQMRNAHMSEPVTIIHVAGSLSVQASVIEPESNINSAGIRNRTDAFLFIFNKSEVSSIPIQRGVKITRAGKMYEVIINRDTPQYHNDPNMNELVVPAKLCS
jgi:hypothetical protein